MNNEKENPAVVRDDEICCLILHGEVTNTAPLSGTEMTEITIDVRTVNGTPIQVTEEWFPLKVAGDITEDDEVNIRVALVKPTSTANDTIKASVDYVNSIVEFDDVTFVIDEISNSEGGDYFYTILPTGIVEPGDEIRLRFEVIKSENEESNETATDETGEVVLKGRIDENNFTNTPGFTTSVPALGLVDVQILPLTVNGIVIPEMEDAATHCYIPLPNYPDVEKEMSFRIIPGASAPDTDKQTLVHGTVNFVDYDFSNLGLVTVSIDVNSINGTNVKDNAYVMVLILPESLELKDGQEFQFAFEPVPGDETEQ